MKARIIDLFEKRVAEADPLSGPDYDEIAESVARDLDISAREVNEAVLEHELRFVGA